MNKQKRQSIFIILIALLSLNLIFVSNLLASAELPEVRHSVEPLNLSRPPTTEELMSAGQLGGQLYPTAEEDKHEDRKDEINLSFGNAIQEWNKHNYKEAINLFKKHVQDYADSPWASEAVLHIGYDAQYNGRFTEAQDSFNWIIENNKDKSYEGARRLRSKAMLGLGVLKVLQNNLDEASSIFANLKKESLSWRERTYASHWIQRISRNKAQGLARLNCGSEALAYLMEKEGKKIEASEIVQIVPSSENGHSISDLIGIASSYGYELAGLQLSTSELNKLPLPAIMQITSKNNGDKGHYWVLEKAIDSGLELYDPQGRQRFTQSTEEFSEEWTGKALVSAAEISGQIAWERLSDNEMEETYGGCCGVPIPEEDLGDPDDDPGEPDKVKDDDPCAKGSPIWKVNKVNMNLYVKDIPMWYKPPFGPPVDIKLSYNSQSAIAYHEPFGNKWMFNYDTYLVVDTHGNVTIFMPDGRRDDYYPDGSGGYSKPSGVFNTLTKIAENYYELSFMDGTVYVYDIPSGTNSLQPFLVEIKDAYSQKLTFGYDSNVQLTTITDALNTVVATLTYNSDGLVERIDDAFGRFVTFEYENHNLTKVTDMGGYWTEYA